MPFFDIGNTSYWVLPLASCTDIKAHTIFSRNPDTVVVNYSNIPANANTAGYLNTAPVSHPSLHLEASAAVSSGPAQTSTPSPQIAIGRVASHVTKPHATLFSGVAPGPILSIHCCTSGVGNPSQSHWQPSTPPCHRGPGRHEHSTVSQLA